jgi:predicted RNase H-like HicB family nuclease
VNPFPYRVVVRWSEPDEAYVAEVPSLPGAAGDGASPEEAVRAAQECANEFLRLKKEHGDPIPPPDILEQFSGQLRLRMPKSLHRELADAAEREGVSLNQLMVMYLAREVRQPPELTHRPETAAESTHVPPAVGHDAVGFAAQVRVETQHTVTLPKQDTGVNDALLH